MTDHHDELALAVWLGLLRVTHKVERAATEQLRAKGLTPAQFNLLRRIHYQPNPSQQDLVEQMDVTRGNISQLISKLEAEGWVVRTPQGSSNYLELTPAGQKLLAELMPDHDRFLTDQFAALSRDEQAQLVALLTKLEGDSC